jgi:hypothetical protein
MDIGNRINAFGQKKEARDDFRARNIGAGFI